MTNELIFKLRARRSRAKGEKNTKYSLSGRSRLLRCARNDKV